VTLSSQWIFGCSFLCIGTAKLKRNCNKDQLMLFLVQTLLHTGIACSIKGIKRFKRIYTIEELQLLLVLFRKFFLAMRVFKHVERVKQIKLLVSTLSHVKYKRLLFLAFFLLVYLHKSHKLLIFASALPRFYSSIAESYQ